MAGISVGEGWRQVEELGMALLLSSSIGLEREIHQKSAGLRTHTLVGVGAALFMLISKYGFNDVLHPAGRPHLPGGRRSSPASDFWGRASSSSDATPCGGSRLPLPSGSPQRSEPARAPAFRYSPQ